jgi:hypothetical protein
VRRIRCCRSLTMLPSRRRIVSAEGNCRMAGAERALWNRRLNDVCSTRLNGRRFRVMNWRISSSHSCTENGILAACSA